MKQSVLLSVLFVVFITQAIAQVGINTDGSAPNPSAMLDVKSNNKGLLPPRMTNAQRNSLSSPTAGMLIFNTSSGMLNIFNGTYWADPDGSPADLWKCGQYLTDDRDGKTYNTVLIGTQCWMAQNLNVGTKITGFSNNNGIIEKYCYNNNDSLCDIYGGLYMWVEMMNYTTSSNSNPSGRQGICPTGWHIPSDAEWCQLEIYLDPTIICTNMGWRVNNSGGKIKEIGTNHWPSPNLGATNITGFTALPGGVRDNSFGGVFVYLGSVGSFWTATEYSAGEGYLRGTAYDHIEITRSWDLVYSGWSCRCVKD